MNNAGIRQPTDCSISTLNKFKNNVSGTTNCSENIIHKPPRFADKFIKISSVRYKPEKIYTKQCPGSKPICERTQCQNSTRLINRHTYKISQGQSSNSTMKCPYTCID
uniref:Uncharacterized protein n=1 Tax=Schizaphis graminum TaxID=13262 RepID=A0A2S2NA56_SCHGA